MLIRILRPLHLWVQRLFRLRNHPSFFARSAARGW